MAFDKNKHSNKPTKKWKKKIAVAKMQLDVPAITRRIQLTQSNNLLLETLYTKTGASQNGVVNKSLEQYKRSLEFADIEESDFYLWYVKGNIDEVSDDIITTLTTENLSRQEMKTFLSELLFRKLTSHDWDKRIVMKKYHTYHKLIETHKNTNENGKTNDKINGKSN